MQYSIKQVLEFNLLPPTINQTLRYDGIKWVNSSGLLIDSSGNVNVQNNLTINTGNVGIGTLSPTSNLELVGSFKFVDGNQVSGYVLTTDSSGVASWATSSVGGTDLTGLGIDNRIARWNISNTIQVSDWFINDVGTMYPNTDSNEMGISSTNRIGKIYLGGNGFGGDSKIILATGSFSDRFNIQTESGSSLIEINTAAGLGNVGIGVSTGNNGRLSVKGGIGHTELFTLISSDGYNLLRTFNNTKGVQLGTSSDLTIAGGNSTIQINARLGIRGNVGENILILKSDTGSDFLTIDNDTRTFDLGSGITSNFRYNNGSQALDYVLVSDSLGNATWKDVGLLSGSGSTIVSVIGVGTNNHIIRWNGTQSAQDSGLIIDDLDNLTGVNDLTVNNNVIVHGDLTINGTTSTINSENLLVKDPIILLAGSQSGVPTLDSGLFINRGTSMTQSFLWLESSDQFALISTTNSHQTQGIVDINGYSSLRIGGFQLSDGSESNGYVLISDSVGVTSWTASTNLAGDGNGIFTSSNNGATVSSTYVTNLTDTWRMNGNIGIGVNPSAPLHVNGNIIFNDSSANSTTLDMYGLNNVNSTQIRASYTGKHLIGIYNPNLSQWGHIFYTSDVNNSSETIAHLDASNSGSVKLGGNFIYDTTLALDVRNVSNSSFLSILKSNGNVGIGTTIPNAKLHTIGGDVRFEGSLNSNLFNTSYINDNVGIGIVPTSSAKLHISGSLQANSSRHLLSVDGSNTIGLDLPTLTVRAFGSGNIMEALNGSTSVLKVRRGGQMLIGDGSSASGFLSILSTGGSGNYPTAARIEQTIGSTSTVPSRIIHAITSVASLSGNKPNIGIEVDVSGHVGGLNYGIIVSNGTVGIGTISPTEKLHLVGNLRYSPGSESNGYILVSDSTGVASWTSSNNIGVGSVNKSTNISNYISGVTSSVTHNLNTLDIIVQCYDSSGLQIVPGVIDITGTGSVDILFSSTLSSVKTVMVG